MKKAYVNPVAEKIEFRYREQVTASIGGTSCTQNWLGFGDSATAGCNLTVAVPDSGF